ncbi:hypothetical protein [Fictibacillus terranigra]|uniref:Uncharacterized protein n=1 Tax=Fictibacillus terranigra TaxID=3058424 RepID=A0ABT8E1L4_9BACL|nr:hypothetical protein [Fictibacillus sp. CENA-BCM004]MDN4071790.1 hypothetical protein [Fictibacillus sp. CENA-BCM004]
MKQDYELLQQKQKLMEEISQLETLDSKYRLYINRLRGKQMGIRRIIEQANSWRSGQSQKAFQMELQDYFGQYTRKINEMETISDNIKKAKHAAQNSLTLLLVSRGPKW